MLFAYFMPCDVSSISKMGDMDMRVVMLVVMTIVLAVPSIVVAQEDDTGTICLAAFDDANGDGLFNPVDEDYIAGVEVTLRRQGRLVTSYFSGAESNCLTDLEAGLYIFEFNTPFGQQPTTSTTGTLSLDAGARLRAEFGTTSLADECTPDTLSAEIKNLAGDIASASTYEDINTFATSIELLILEFRSTCNPTPIITTEVEPVATAEVEPVATAEAEPVVTAEVEPVTTPEVDFIFEVDDTIDIYEGYTSRAQTCFILADVSRSSTDSLSIILSGERQDDVIVDIFRPESIEHEPVQSQRVNTFVDTGNVYILQTYSSRAWALGTYRLRIELGLITRTFDFELTQQGDTDIFVHCD